MYQLQSEFNSFIPISDLMHEQFRTLLSKISITIPLLKEFSIIWKKKTTWKQAESCQQIKTYDICFSSALSVHFLSHFYFLYYPFSFNINYICGFYVLYVPHVNTVEFSFLFGTFLTHNFYTSIYFLFSLLFTLHWDYEN